MRVGAAIFGAIVTMTFVGRAAVAGEATAPPSSDSKEILEALPPPVPIVPRIPAKDPDAATGGGSATTATEGTPKLPRLDPRREAKAFAKELAEAIRVHDSGYCTQAYARYLLLAARQSEHPDVLWGLGECGATTAHALTDEALRRRRMEDARTAYLRYAEVERRPKYARGAKSRVARARVRVSQLNGEIARLALVVALPPPSVSSLAAPPSSVPSPTPAAPPPPPAAAAPSSAAETATAATPAASPSAASGMPSARDRFAHAKELARQGNLPDAVAEAETLLRDMPETLLFQEQLVIWRAMLGECESALTEYRRIHAVASQSDTHEAAADCAERAENPFTLLQALEGYVRTASYVEPTTFFDLGEIYAAMGETEKAIAMFERYIAVERRATFAERRRRAEAFLGDLRAATAGVSVVSAEEQLRCLARRQLVRAQIMEGGRMVLYPPPNWRNIPCVTAARP